MIRTHTCGELRAGDVGSEVVVCGWVDSVRDHGGVLFVDVRDHTGVTQTVAHPDEQPEGFAAAEAVRGEWVVAVRGRVRMRPEGTQNPDLPTGAVEVPIDAVEVLSVAEPLPIPLDERTETDEILRLRHRPLDLRKERLQRNLRTRARVSAAVRAALEAEGFVEVETPTLIRSTPEGARDYLVPSRQTPGSVYALPQSPQLFKQLLMVGGIDRYYQIARCWRDEDLRADRQPEFTQLDLEASFAEPEDVYAWIEAAMRAAFEAAGRSGELPETIPRLTWHDAMDLYGSDKPDLRAGPPIVDLAGVFAGTAFKAFAATLDAGGTVRGWRFRGGGDLTRNRLDGLIERAQHLGAKGLVWMVVEADASLRAPVAKFLSDAELAGIGAALDAEPGDLLLLAADTAQTASAVLGQLRLDLDRPAGHAPVEAGGAGVSPLWVVDFPLFEDDGAGGLTPLHHPFTSPHRDDIHLLDTDPAAVRSHAYDFVINGVEMGSGSVRIHDAAVQARMFEILGMEEAEVRSRFGFLLDAFRHGVPPHAGFAVGWDRLLMILCDERSIREVIAFPKTQTGADPLTGAPAAVGDDVLADVGLQMTPEARAVAAAEAGTEAGDSGA